jgi:hypothetical protein
MTPAASRSLAETSLGVGKSGATSSGLHQLFAPLENLLVAGGDPRLTLDPASRLNAYHCGPAPSHESWEFASSTASTISERGYARAERAREELMRSAIDVGFDEAFDTRAEELREELKAALQIPADVGVVFSPSGTDSQLHALFVARAWLGPALTTIIVGSDQTGSGTVHTARGRHFSDATAGGRAVAKETPIPGLACESIALPLLDETSGAVACADLDAAVLRAVATALATGSAVLLQIMDASKLGWRAPSKACLDEIARRWPERVAIAVDACQMRLSRARLRGYLARGCMVLVSGSKFFGGPAFSGALLVPAALSRLPGDGDVEGLHDYAARSDWPKAWTALRSSFAIRPNPGQWLRWEAALAEINAYYAVPAAYRKFALSELSGAIESLILLSPSLQAIAPGPHAGFRDDDEFGCPTIVPFTLRRNGRPLSADGCQALYRALARDLGAAIGGSPCEQEVAARRCLLGQPVRIGRHGEQPVAALRFCLGARQVTETWSPDAATARRNLEHELDRIADVIAKTELLLGSACKTALMELSYGV